jgi:Protein-L-isoaspartate(D-aspartate) O-methyltransferase (PCMT)
MQALFIRASSWTAISHSAMIRTLHAPKTNSSPSSKAKRMATPTVCVIAAALLLALARTAAAQDFAAERRRMVEDSTALVRETRAEIGNKRAFDERVMTVMARVPRHEFVPAGQVAYAYQNRPLPIGHGQTVSQPYIVALMTDLARVEPGRCSRSVPARATRRR